MENYGLQGHVTEANLISFSGSSRQRRGKSRCVLLRVPQDKSDAAECWVLARASEPEIFSNPEPLHDSLDGHPTAPIRPFVLSTRRPPSPNALRAPGLVDVVHRDRGGLGLPAGQ